MNLIGNIFSFLKLKRAEGASSHRAPLMTREGLIMGGVFIAGIIFMGIVITDVILVYRVFSQERIAVNTARTESFKEAELLDELIEFMEARAKKFDDLLGKPREAPPSTKEKK